MPDFPMNNNPRLTKYLVARGAFRQEPFVIVDAGALGGYDSHWNYLQDQVRILAFEPAAGGDADRKADVAVGCRLMSYALGRENGTAALHVYGHPAASSLYSANPAYWNRLTGGEMYRTEHERTVEVRRLDDVLREEGVGSVDFMKLDVEGSELDVLMGAPDALQSSATTGIAFEFSLSRHAFRGADRRFGTFFDIHDLLDRAGFELYDISTYRFARSVLPQPFAYHYVNTQGEYFAGPTIRGQKVNGDAVYFRDLALATGTDRPRTMQVLKAACLLELYGLNDCAAELLDVHRDAVAQVERVADLLDLLVTELDEVRLSHSEYLAAFRSDRRRFMPSSGFRFPDHTVHTFDGTFIPRQRYHPRPGGEPLIRLTREFIDRGWRPGTQQTAVRVEGDRIRIDSDRSHFSYQLVSSVFETIPHGDYVLSYDVHTLTGAATVGVVDGEAGSWIAQTNVLPGKSAGHLHFVAPGKRAQIVVANFSCAEESSSSVEIADLGVWEAETSTKSTFK
jgi:FkbM family methyltransferase